MQALQFSDSIPRYVLTKVVGGGYRPVFWSDLACLQLRDVPPPRLPTPEWVRIKTRYGGICGSDLGLILLHTSTATTPFVSFPFTVGHENVGTIAELGEAVEGFAVGQRVVVDPVLGCTVRGFRELCPACARGDRNLCLRFREGTIAPGMLTGFCRDTGGSWSPSFVAHQSQLVPVPDHVSDENALMAEPFAGALHAVLRNRPQDDQTVLILGAGVLGLCTVAAIRAIGSRARVIVAARHPLQREMAARYGADLVLRETRGPDLFRAVARETGGDVHKPLIGKHVVRGGADLVFDCVGSDETLDDGLRLTAPGGRLVLVGLAAIPRGVDWSTIWMKELTVRGTYCYAIEEVEGERISTMALTVRLMAQGKLDLAPLVTHRFRLEDYRTALDTVTRKGRSGVIKAAFAFD
ncbi:MAG: alcohol dehydrogenase catalytic domain-containing protein [Sphaerobacter sp.]|nr:alcohol dehydrogenase catalytic domain-containing protein [Sphaerobacter sp.]